MLGRVCAAGASLSKMQDIDAAWKRMDVAMPPPLGFVEALAAGEHQVGTGKHLSLQCEQPRRGAFERRQLVHVVVNAQIRLQMAAERQREWRVVPSRERAGLHSGQKLVEQSALQPRDCA